MKLIDQVNRTTTYGATVATAATAGGTGGSGSAYLIPPTPSMTAGHHRPGLASCSTTPAATPSLTPPRTLMSTLQVGLPSLCSTLPVFSELCGWCAAARKHGKPRRGCFHAAGRSSLPSVQHIGSCR